MIRFNDRHHAFLRLAHQDLFGAEPRVAQRYQIKINVHSAVTGAGQLGGGTRESRATEVLDSGDQPGCENLQRALDEQLLQEWIADLDAGALAGLGVIEGLRGEHTDPADAVCAGRGTVQDHLVAGAGCLRQVQVFVAEHSDAQGIDQRIAEIGAVEGHLTADVG